MPRTELLKDYISSKNLEHRSRNKWSRYLIFFLKSSIQRSSYQQQQQRIGSVIKPVVATAPPYLTRSTSSSSSYISTPIASSQSSSYPRHCSIASETTTETLLLHTHTCSNKNKVTTERKKERNVQNYKTSH
jgi:hypothetical protein